MSGYKRKSYLDSRYSRELTKVSIHWSMKADSYAIFFHKNGKWFPTKERFAKIQNLLIRFIDSLPYGEKLKEVKIDIVNNEEVQTWTYYIIEKHLERFKELVEMMPEDFKIDFIEKPLETSSFSSKITLTKVWLARFNEITGEDITKCDYNTAKKLYRRYCMALHPDRNHNSQDAADQMSKLNEIWTALEIQHFKTKQIPEQEKEPVNV